MKMFVEKFKLSSLDRRLWNGFINTQCEMFLLIASFVLFFPLI